MIESISRQLDDIISICEEPASDDEWRDGYSSDDVSPYYDYRDEPPQWDVRYD